MFWSKFKNFILKLFGKKVDESDGRLAHNEIDTRNYLDITGENITAIIANALSILTFGDAQLTITPDNAMQSIINDVLQKEFNKAKTNISCGIGVGMIASIPYCVDNGLGRKIYVDTVTKDRFFITGVQGTDITQFIVLAGVKKIDGHIYTRWTEYAINNGSYIIKNKCMKDNTEVLLSAVADWANIVPEITINGVERLPIGIFRCPAGNRRPNDISGVPITFGCKGILKKIENTFADIESEFKNKKVKVFADRTLLRPEYDAQGNIIGNDFSDDIFVKFGSSDNFTTEIFSPEFRQTAYFEKLKSHFSFLEKQIGISKGILTDLETHGATATEIKRSTYQTFCLIDDIRKGYMQYITDLAYGIEVLANAYGLATVGEYDINIDWSYAMLEDSQETFNQKVQGLSSGVERPEELRMFLHPSETLEEAKEVIESIKENTPPIEQLI